MNPMISIPEKVTVPESDWKTFLEGNELKYGVKWIIKRCSKDAPMRTETTQEEPAQRKRRRLFDYFWYANYACHRSGNKRDKVAEGKLVRGGMSGKPRISKKLSKKIMCDAKLKVIAYKSSPGFVDFIYSGEHNHEGENPTLNLLPSLQFAMDSYSQNPWSLDQDQLKIVQCSVEIIINVLQNSPTAISNTNLYLDNTNE
jgi:hypothetical protein